MRVILYPGATLTVNEPSLIEVTALADVQVLGAANRVTGKPYSGPYDTSDSHGDPSEVMMDVIELNLLSGLEDKRNRQARIDHQQNWGVKQMAAIATPGINGSTVTAAGTPTPAPAVNPLPSAPAFPELIAQPKGIMNRSPITYNHYYTQPSGTTVVETPPAPATTTWGSVWPWLLAGTFALALGGLAWYLLTRPKPPTPPNWTDSPSIILQ